MTNGEWLAFMDDGGYAKAAPGSLMDGIVPVRSTGTLLSIGSAETATGWR